MKENAVYMQKNYAHVSENCNVIFSNRTITLQSVAGPRMQGRPPSGLTRNVTPRNRIG